MGDGVHGDTLQQLSLQRRQYPQHRAGQRQCRPGVLTRDLPRSFGGLCAEGESTSQRVGAKPSRSLSQPVLRRQPFERYQSLLFYCAERRFRAIHPGGRELGFAMSKDFPRARAFDRRSFISHSLAAGALLAAPRWSKSAAPQPRVLVDWHSHFVSNAEIKFFAGRREAPRLLTGPDGLTR